MLEQLAKRDKDWRKMAFVICKDHILADDLVQEMYLKFANYNKEINDYYVFFALRGIFIDQIRQNKKLSLLYTDNIELLSISDKGYDFDKDALTELVSKSVNELPYFERELLKVTQEISQRELGRQTGISFEVINKTIKKTKNEVKLRIWQDQKKLKG